MIGGVDHVIHNYVASTTLEDGHGTADLYPSSSLVEIWPTRESLILCLLGRCSKSVSSYPFQNGSEWGSTGQIRLVVTG